jgi:hypothetical protein
MRALGIVSTAAVALVSLVSVASAAVPNTVHPANSGHYTAGVSGNVERWPAASSPYPKGDLWPRCYGGEPQCTAAGYPNLHYSHELQGLPY